MEKQFEAEPERPATPMENQETKKFITSRMVVLLALLGLVLVGAISFFIFAPKFSDIRTKLGISDVPNISAIDEQRDSFSEQEKESESILSAENGYVKNDRQVYYDGEVIMGADPSTFVILDSGNSESVDLYAKDAKNVFFAGSVIAGADPETFSVIPIAKEYQHFGTDYGKDANHVYYANRILNNADPATFVPKGYEYAIDAKHLFFGENRIDLLVDLESFEALRWDIVKDAVRVYYQDWDEFYGTTREFPPYKLLEEVDASTFELVGGCSSVEKSTADYFKDKNSVFVEINPYKEIDVHSFEYLGEYYAEGGMPYSAAYALDRYNVYTGCGAILEGADRTTFVDLGDGYAKDRDSVWYLGDIISDADASTLQVVGRGYAKDKSLVYYMGYEVEDADWGSCSTSNFEACGLPLF